MYNRIYFFAFSYAVGGGDIFFFRLIEYILKFTDIKVGIIDFSDGILTRTGKKYFSHDDIHYISFEDQYWNLENNSLIFCPGDRIGYIKENNMKNIKIAIYHWNSDISWSTLFKKKTFLKLSKLLKVTNACSFIDYGCYIFACHDFKQNFKKNYIPLYFYKKDCPPTKRTPDLQEINIIWLGRLSTSKTVSLKNIIENFSRYKTDKKKIFHIIGNGNDEDYLKEYCKPYKNIRFIFTGVLTENELDKYLQEHTDIGFAMGTSMMNFASLHLPVIAAHEPRGDLHTNKFQWLFNLFEYCLGSPSEEGDDFAPMFQNISTFDQMLDDICLHDKYTEYGEKCYQYYRDNHSNIEQVGCKFIECIKDTKLTYNQLKKCIKYIPYDSPSGILEKNFYLFNIPFIKIIHHLNDTYAYFMGIRVFRKIDNGNQCKTYFLGMKLTKYRTYGKWSFPTITSPEIKEQCKDKYSISERIF